MHKYGLIGLATMGENLARNFADKGISIAVYNRTTQVMKEFVDEYGTDRLAGYADLKEFVASIARPRKIILLVKAGEPVDKVIAQLLPLLDKGDIIIDGGNSNYKDTRRRLQEVGSKGIDYVGMGVSGGAEGALKGPSMMPGGNKEVIETLLPDLEKVAAADFENGRTVTYIGPDGAGHFVKMVHNGIEYALMQMLVEIYDYLHVAEEFSYEQIHKFFSQFLETDHNSYLLEITVEILSKQHDGKPLLDLIDDKAGNKGTGRWTSEAAMELGVPTPTITEALFARYLSANQDRRQSLSSKLEILKPSSVDDVLLDHIMMATSILAFDQGLQLIEAASKEYNWQVDLAEALRIWQGGCIIRANYLKQLREVVSDGGDLLASDFAKQWLGNDYQNSVPILTASGIPLPVVNSAYNYLLGVSRDRLPTYLIQAQRDHFGQHGVKLMDNRQRTTDDGER